ncbi:hypothetical protein Tco_0045174, partial [Tanacetum coccineum]
LGVSWNWMAAETPRVLELRDQLKRGVSISLSNWGKRPGVHTSHSTIPIEEGDPDAKHKLCIKYASDEDSASDCDTPVHLYAVVDWELFPTGLGSIKCIYMTRHSRKRLKILMDSPELNDGISGLVIHMFVDKKYPLSVNLIERMLDHQLEICHGTVGNELTTAVQLIAFLKKQISDSKRPKVHECFSAASSKLLPFAGSRLVMFGSNAMKTNLLDTRSVQC